MSDRHVLYVGTLFESGAAEAYGIDDYSLAGEHKKRSVIRALQSADVSVTIISPVSISGGSVFATAGEQFHDDDLDTDVYVPPSIGLGMFELALLMLTTLLLAVVVTRRERPDAVLFYNFKLQTAIPGAVSATLSRASLLVEYEDGMFVDPETVSVVRKVAYWLRRGTQSTIDGAICASDPLTTLLKTENTVVFRGFPSIGMPDELPEPVDDSGSQTVMFSGRFDDVRGINTFLDIVPAVAEQVDDARFWIAGYGDEKACARIQAEAETLSCNATYFGTLPWEEYRARIVSANVLVNFQDPTLPISKYTFPSKLLDYMSAGATVVTTNVGDIKETFRNELYITAFDDEKLANAVAICLTEEEMNSYNDRAQAWIKKECDEEVVGKRISRVLETAI